MEGHIEDAILGGWIFMRQRRAVENERLRRFYADIPRARRNLFPEFTLQQRAVEPEFALDAISCD